VTQGDWSTGDHQLTVYEWIYDSGQNHYVRTLHFEDGVLTGISSRWVGGR
jgi:hypothetical protein